MEAIEVKFVDTPGLLEIQLILLVERVSSPLIGREGISAGHVEQL